MMYGYRVVLGAIGVLIGLVAYGFYFRSIFRGSTRPHSFTWTTYALNDGVVFFAQFLGGGGPGAWPTLLSVIENTVVVIVSFRYGERRITAIDWISFMGALLGIALWWRTNDPLAAVLIASVVNILGVVPTFGKAWSRPFEESISIWGADIFRFGIAIPALVIFNPTTALFPVVIMITNTSLVSMILLRRRQMSTGSGRLEP